MRQGNDVGTQYRAAIDTYGDEQQQLAEQSRVHFQRQLTVADVLLCRELSPAISGEKSGRVPLESIVRDSV
jgi:peptide-methionine (S)-S-oxide reductase